MKNSIVLSVLTAGILLFSGCGSSSSNSSDDDSTNEETATEITGQFIDSEVSGLDYICSVSGMSGRTSAQGEYTCLNDEQVSFYLGELLLGRVDVADVITPLTLFPNNEQAALNLARLLQTLDSDGDPDNGITIDEEDLNQFAGSALDFTSDNFEAEVEVIIEEELIDEDDAREHLNESMVSQGIDPIEPVAEDITTDNFGGTTQTLSFTQDTTAVTSACVTRYGTGARAANWEELDTFMTTHPNDIPTLLSNFFMSIDDDKLFINSLNAQGGETGRYMINRVTASDIEFVELNDDTWRGVACYIPTAQEEQDEEEVDVVEGVDEGCENPKVIGELEHLDISYAQAGNYCASVGGKLPTIEELEIIYNIHGQKPPHGFDSELVSFWSTSVAPDNQINDPQVYAAYLEGEFEAIAFRTLMDTRGVMCVENTCYAEPQVVPEPEPEVIEECENPKLLGEPLTDSLYNAGSEYCVSLGGRLPTITELESIYNAHNQEAPNGYDDLVGIWTTSQAPDDEWGDHYLYTAYLNLGGDFNPEPMKTDASRSVACVENTCYAEPQIIPEPDPEPEPEAFTLSNFGITSAIALFSFTDSTASITSNCVEMHGDGSRAANWAELNEFITNNPNDVFRLVENFQMESDGDKLFINLEDAQWGETGRYMINRVTASDIEFVELNDDTHRKAVCYIP